MKEGMKEGRQEGKRRKENEGGRKEIKGRNVKIGEIWKVKKAKGSMVKRIV
jgi:hypothetical protein